MTTDDMVEEKLGKPLAGLLLPNGEITPGKRGRRSLRQRNALVACGLKTEGKRVLDIGCAEGLHSLYVAGRAAEVVGVDHRRSKIDIAQASARALGVRNATFIAGDIRDKDLFKKIGKFDLIMAWGFLHRISDIFSFLYSIEPLADALSLEWRTPVVPMMSRLSVAYHYPEAPALDPMNVSSAVSEAKVEDRQKIEGSTGFWEPTPGAVAAIVRRLGYVHSRLLGYDEDMVSEERIMARVWARHLAETQAGAVPFERLPTGRLHMLFEKRAGSILTDEPLDSAHVPLPKWDTALLRAVARKAR